MLQVHEVLYVPSWMAKFCAWTLEPLFSSSEPTSEARVGMGATVDIQRQQRMELLDRQLMLSQFAHVRRPRQQQVNGNNHSRKLGRTRACLNVSSETVHIETTCHSSELHRGYLGTFPRSLIVAILSVFFER